MQQPVNIAENHMEPTRCSDRVERRAVKSGGESRALEKTECHFTWSSAENFAQLSHLYTLIKLITEYRLDIQLTLQHN